MSLKRVNNFGKLGKAYDSVRRGYPKTVFAYLKKLAKGKGIKVLDIGCGTGLATRDLKKNGFEVVGADKDAVMLEFARKRKSGIPYIVAPANKLPFKNNEFDVVTAFTALHWFADKKSLREIKRVLKKGGLFFTALKDPSEEKRFQKLRNAYVALLKTYLLTLTNPPN